LFGTEALRNAGGFDSKYGHFDDVAAEFLCAAHGGRADVRELKASLREHRDSVTRGAVLDDWCQSSLALLELAYFLVGSRNRELRRIGSSTSADRNYRYASEAVTKWEQLKQFWTVFRHFGYREFPQRRHVYRSFHGSDTSRPAPSSMASGDNGGRRHETALMRSRPSPVHQWPQHLAATVATGTT
jgi:hypothetical protein